MSDVRFREVLEELWRLHVKKGQDYGTEEDEFANVRASANWGVDPWIGALIRANDKIARLQTFVKKGKLVNESVEDSLLDLANYAIISLILYREHGGNDAK